MVPASSRLVPATIWMRSMGRVDLCIGGGEQSRNAEWNQEVCVRKTEGNSSLKVLNYRQIDDCKSGTQVHIKEHSFLLGKLVSVPCNQKEVANTDCGIRRSFAGTVPVRGSRFVCRVVEDRTAPSRMEEQAVHVRQRQSGYRAGQSQALGLALEQFQENKACG